MHWDDNPDLNITPLVDIMLVLLAILMVTAPAVVYEEQIELPSGSKTTKNQQDSKIEIRVDLGRTIYVGSQKYTYDNFADNFVKLSQGYDKNTQVYIRADKNLKYDDVVYLLKISKEAGFSRVSLVTDG